MRIAGHASLEDFVCHIEYDVTEKCGKLCLQATANTSLSGPLQLFTDIDPLVERIEVSSGDKLVAVYYKNGEVWESLLDNK